MSLCLDFMVWVSFCLDFYHRDNYNFLYIVIYMNSSILQSGYPGFPEFSGRSGFSRPPFPLIYPEIGGGILLQTFY
jgi:hypothetical protein